MEEPHFFSENNNHIILVIKNCFNKKEKIHEGSAGRDPDSNRQI